ncbi:unnamed protein product [Peniophora sp. CBMAI 1063]|nr:unnamed protein product [Peniophora sp. CBMAI 1063]
MSDASYNPSCQLAVGPDALRRQPATISSALAPPVDTGDCRYVVTDDMVFVDALKEGEQAYKRAQSYYEVGGYVIPSDEVQAWIQNKHPGIFDPPPGEDHGPGPSRGVEGTLDTEALVDFVMFKMDEARKKRLPVGNRVRHISPYLTDIVEGVFCACNWKAVQRTGYLRVQDRDFPEDVRGTTGNGSEDDQVLRDWLGEPEQGVDIEKLVYIKQCMLVVY